MEQHDGATRHRHRAGGPVSVAITLLGRFEVAVNGVATPARGWARRGAAGIVKVLALTPGHALHREQVLDLLWPDEPIAVSAPRLHKAAHFARRAAGHDDAVVLRGDVVRLFPDADLTVDAIEFERGAKHAMAVRKASAARDALAWYGGDLLPADRYEDWAADRREVLRLRHLELLRVAGQWRELAELDPTNEEPHLELMRRHLDEGDGRAALLQYALLDQVLARELGASPGDEVLQACLDGAHSAEIVDLLGELARLVARQSAVLAELAAAGAAPRAIAGAERFA